MEIRAAAVIGLGTMGAGIAEVLARGGLAVTAIDLDPPSLARGMGMLDSSLSRAVARGRLAEPDRAEIRARIRPAAALAAAAAADLVVEAVPERMEIKHRVFAELDRACGPAAILATNTSSLPVTAIAAATGRPDRVVGLHFFNPAPVMKLVEVVSTVLTAPAVTAAVAGLARLLGKTPVTVGDRAGFIANALLLPYLNHAAALLGSGYASREDIDAAAELGIGLPMGPLALLDLIGLDTSLSILEVLHGELGGPRYAPAPLLRRLVEAGQTGRKSGRGFFDYAGTGAAAGQPSAAGRAGNDRQNEDAAPGPAVVTLVDMLLYPHLNDAVRMVQDGYASAADVDTAMTLGCGYPRGPLELLDEAGPAAAIAVLRAMHAADGDPVFAPAPLLAEHAAAGLKFRS